MKIHCKDCTTHLGEIRKATLMKGVVHQCPKCAKKDSLRKLAEKLKPKNSVESMLDEMFKGKL